MASKDDLEALRPQIEAIPAVAVRSPTQPVETFISEGLAVAKWAAKDKDRLIQTGLDWTLVESVPTRAGALRHSESEWMMQFGTPAGQAAWKEAEAEGLELREDMLAGMRFGFRDNEQLLDKVAMIVEGASQADLVQDLNDISTLGLANLDALTSIVTEEDLNRAADLSKQMADLLAARDADDSADPARLLRDKAYTYLATVVDEIRAYGRYISRKNPSRASGYMRKYRPRRSNGRAAETRAQVPA